MIRKISWALTLVSLPKGTARLMCHEHVSGPAAIIHSQTDDAIVGVLALPHHNFQPPDCQVTLRCQQGAGPGASQ